jgi:hypothetical protein
MDIEVLKILGQVAGLAGVSLGVFLLIFRDIIGKKVFPTLTKSQAFRLFVLLSILTWSIAVFGIGAWLFAESRPTAPFGKTGISDKLTIKGDVSIEVITGVKLNDLIALLEQRAKKVAAHLQARYGAEAASELIARFQELHKKHIAHLRAGEVIAAHEVLIEIHQFSYETAGLWSGSYYCGRPYYIRGPVIVGYMLGAFDPDSPSYPLSDGEEKANEERNGCGPTYTMASPWDAIRAYQEIGRSRTSN